MDELIRELKSQGVLRSPYVEAAFRAIDRQDFVRPEYASQAYSNYPLPIGEGQTISQPWTVAFMLDLLEPKPGEKILDIGSGSGWTTALLAHIVSQQGGNQKSKTKNQKFGEVLAVERILEICRFGEANVEKYNFIQRKVAKFCCRDGTLGLPEGAPFDKILAGAAAFEKIPNAWREQLNVGGRIVAPVGSSVWRYTKLTQDQWQEEEFSGFAFVPLVDEQIANRQAQSADDSGQGTTSSELENSAGGGGSKRRRTLFTLCALLSALCGYVIFAPVAPPPGGAEIEIPAGAGSMDIAGLLKSKGLIRSKWAFIIYAAITGRADRFKPGSYKFEGRPVALPAVAARIAEGGTEANELTITVPEGWDLRDLAGFFEDKGLFPAAEFYALAGTPAQSGLPEKPPPAEEPLAQEFPALGDKPASAGLEGYLFPDTYRVFRQAKPEGIIRKMLANFEQKLTPDLRAEIARQKKSVFEIITVASVIEKEIPHEEDRGLVAGILYERLRLGLALQVDASVNYATGKRKTPSAEDLGIDSPYNTYRYPGLPPGPISNPGLGAIRAAVYPKPSAYLYYLSADDGRTIFSKTLEEHSAAKAKYLKHE